jgi:hypothetical protein
MTLYRCQVVHKHNNGLPRDSFVNVFHVLTDAATDVRANAIAEAVRDFYVMPPSTGGGPLMNLFGDQVAHGTHEVRMYQLDSDNNVTLPEEGSPPQWTEPFDHIDRAFEGANAGLPSELAVCLSMKNITAGGVPPARRRGRIYFGPLVPGVTEEEATNGRRNVTASVRTSLTQKGKDLQAALEAISGGTHLVVYSRPYAGRDEVVRPGRTTLPALAARIGQTYRVDQFWCDDAIDVQRRRGERPIARTTLSAA